MGMTAPILQEKKCASHKLTCMCFPDLWRRQASDSSLLWPLSLQWGRRTCARGPTRKLLLRPPSCPLCSSLGQEEEAGSAVPANCLPLFAVADLQLKGLLQLQALWPPGGYDAGEYRTGVSGWLPGRPVSAGGDSKPRGRTDSLPGRQVLPRPAVLQHFGPSVTHTLTSHRGPQSLYRYGLYLSMVSYNKNSYFKNTLLKFFVKILNI